MERFERMVAMMGGPSDLSANWRSSLPKAPVVFEVKAEDEGFIAAFDGEALGLAVVALGGGGLISGIAAAVDGGASGGGAGGLAQLAEVLRAEVLRLVEVMRAG